MLKNRTPRQKVEAQEAALKAESTMFCARIDDDLKTKFKVYCAANKKGIADELNKMLKAYLDKHNA
jgi:plasmid stability protein